MVISAKALLVILLAGWLAGQIVQHAGFGFVRFGLVIDPFIGVSGAFLGGWLLPELGIPRGAGLVAAIIYDTIGALPLLHIIGLARGRWRCNWLGW